MKLAACSLVEKLGLPRPVCVDEVLDTAVWRTGVLTRTAAPVDVLEESHDSSDDSVYSVSDSESESVHTGVFLVS